MSRSRLTVILLPLLIGTGTPFGICPLARAQDSKSASGTEVAAAEQYADEAFQAYAKKDYATAVGLYRKAYDAAASADILYNIARIYDTGIRDRPLAITYYRKYVSDPRATPDRIATASERIVQLRAAEDASAVPAANAAGTTTPRAAGPSEPMALEKPSKSPGFPLKIAGISTGAAGVAMLAVGVGMGVAAKSDADVVHQYCDGNACTSQRGVDANESAKSKATVSTVGFVAGSALVGAGLTLWLVGNHRDAADRASGRLSHIRFSPIAGATDLGAAVSGKW
jgi:tetratricopeptide (TPR) repeat protein